MMPGQGDSPSGLLMAFVLVAALLAPVGAPPVSAVTASIDIPATMTPGIMQEINSLAFGFNLTQPHPELYDIQLQGPDNTTWGACTVTAQAASDNTSALTQATILGCTDVGPLRTVHINVTTPQQAGAPVVLDVGEVVPAKPGSFALNVSTSLDIDATTVVFVVQGRVQDLLYTSDIPFTDADDAQDVLTFRTASDLLAGGNITVQLQGTVPSNDSCDGFTLAANGTTTNTTCRFIDGPIPFLFAFDVDQAIPAGTQVNLTLAPMWHFDDLDDPVATVYTSNDTAPAQATLNLTTPPTLLATATGEFWEDSTNGTLDVAFLPVYALRPLQKIVIEATPEVDMTQACNGAVVQVMRNTSFVPLPLADCYPSYPPSFRDVCTCQPPSLVTLILDAAVPSGAPVDLQPANITTGPMRGDPANLTVVVRTSYEIAGPQDVPLRPLARLRDVELLAFSDNDLVLRHLASSSYLLLFNTSFLGEVLPNGTVDVVFPPNTVLPGCVDMYLIDDAGDPVPLLECIINGTALRLQVNATIGANQLFVVAAFNVTNPRHATYNLTVSTSSDTLPVRVPFTVYRPFLGDTQRLILPPVIGKLPAPLPCAPECPAPPPPIPVIVRPRAFDDQGLLAWPTPFAPYNANITYAIGNTSIATLIPSADNTSVTLTPLARGTTTLYANMTIDTGDGLVVRRTQAPVYIETGLMHDPREGPVLNATIAGRRVDGANATTGYSIPIASLGTDGTINITTSGTGATALVDRLSITLETAVTTASPFILEVQATIAPVAGAPDEVDREDAAGLLDGRTAVFLDIKGYRDGDQLDSATLNGILGSVRIRFHIPAANLMGRDPRTVYLVEYSDGLLTNGNIPLTYLGLQAVGHVYEVTLTSFSSFAVGSAAGAAAGGGGGGGGGGPLAATLPTLTNTTTPAPTTTTTSSPAPTSQAPPQVAAVASPEEPAVTPRSYGGWWLAAGIAVALVVFLRGRKAA